MSGGSRVLRMPAYGRPPDHLRPAPAGQARPRRRSSRRRGADVHPRRARGSGQPARPRAGRARARSRRQGRVVRAELRGRGHPGPRGAQGRGDGSAAELPVLRRGSGLRHRSQRRRGRLRRRRAGSAVRSHPGPDSQGGHDPRLRRTGPVRDGVGRRADRRRTRRPAGCAGGRGVRGDDDLHLRDHRETEGGPAPQRRRPAADGGDAAAHRLSPRRRLPHDRSALPQRAGWLHGRGHRARPDRRRAAASSTRRTGCGSWRPTAAPRRSRRRRRSASCATCRRTSRTATTVRRCGS